MLDNVTESSSILVYWNAILHVELTFSACFILSTHFYVPLLCLFHKIIMFCHKKKLENKSKGTSNFIFTPMISALWINPMKFVWSLFLSGFSDESVCLRTVLLLSWPPPVQMTQVLQHAADPPAASFYGSWSLERYRSLQQALHSQTASPMSPPLICFGLIWDSRFRRCCETLAPDRIAHQYLQAHALLSLLCAAWRDFCGLR